MIREWSEVTPLAFGSYIHFIISYRKYNYFLGSKFVSIAVMYELLISIIFS